MMYLDHDDGAVPTRTFYEPLRRRCRLPRIRPQQPGEDRLDYARHVVRLGSGALDLTFRLFDGCSSVEEMKERLEDYTAAIGYLAFELLSDPDDVWYYQDPVWCRDYVSRVIEEDRIGQLFKRLRCDCECPYPGEHDCDEGIELEDLTYEVDPSVFDALLMLLRVEDQEQSQIESLLELRGEFECAVEALRSAFGVSDFDFDVGFGAEGETDY